MEFGLHFLLSCADDRTPRALYREAIEQAVAGEAFGFESIWPAEQHFQRQLSALSCPTLLLAAIAERTRRIRLGTGVVQLPLAHPLRVAEELATLDVLSGGRVELGVGRGSNPAHFAGFGVPVSESRARLGDGLAYLRKAWTEERFSHSSPFFEAHDISLVPRPIQTPHPPIRLAANSPDTAIWAGRAGYPVLLASNVNPFPRMKKLIGMYRSARHESGLPAASADDITVMVPMYCAPTEEQVRREFAPSVAHYAQLVGSLMESALRQCRSESERNALLPVFEQLRRIDYATVQDVMGVVGTPATCRSRLQELARELGTGRVIGWFNFGGLVPHAAVLDSMRVFAGEVMPHFCPFARSA